jgi:hypothetical protein
LTGETTNGVLKASAQMQWVKEIKAIEAVESGKEGKDE